jgi:photosystem II stability/assembly factor-like uncharacterized protein
MKSQTAFCAVLLSLFVILACQPLGAPLTETPVAQVPPTSTVEIPPTTTPTSEEISTITPTAAPPPAATLLPAAPAHFKPGDALQLDEIHMVSLTEGWAISGAYLLATADGGRTWRETTPPETHAADALVKVYGGFPDARTAWIVFSVGDQIPPDASIWRTMDGGVNWTPSAPLSHQAYGDALWAEFASFHDPMRGWAILRGVYVGAGTHYTEQFFRTVDGGLAWTPLGVDVGVDYDGFVFADAAHGLVSWQTVGAYENWPPEYAITANGWDTWESRQLPPPADAPGIFDQYPYCEPYQPNMLSSSSIRILLGCYKYGEPPTEFTGYLYSSEDGGTTWATYPLPASVLASKASLIFFDQTHALLLGREIFKSEDGGQTWQPVKTVNWDGRFSFVDSLHGWAIARAGDQVALVSTQNGGDTWVEIKPVIAH